MYKNKTVLITGGTGSWGHRLTQWLLEKGVGRIIIFSRGELAQVKMARHFSNDSRISFQIGDVRDRSAVDLAMGQGVDYVFHLAALKHVPVCESNPDEAVKTNIRGTQNVCYSAIGNKVKKVIDVSTDKAVAPVNLYGMTKAVGERIMIHANGISGVGGTKFICIRGGNAIGSNGSAIPLFISQVKENNEITLTDERMTRYFMTLEDAVSLIFKAAEIGIGGEVFVMRMPAFYMKTIAEVIAERYGDADTKVTEIGIRPGEKIDETLVSKDEARLTYAFDDDYYLIIPDTMTGLKKYHRYQDLQNFGMGEYTSSSIISDKDEALKTLLDSGFIE
jgi:FlaA1/EpsC-like NDP-sugar epimerase